MAEPAPVFPSVRAISWRVTAGVASIPQPLTASRQSGQSFGVLRRCVASPLELGRRGEHAQCAAGRLAQTAPSLRCLARSPTAHASSSTSPRRHALARRLREGAKADLEAGLDSTPHDPKGGTCLPPRRNSSLERRSEATAIRLEDAPAPPPPPLRQKAGAASTVRAAPENSSSPVARERPPGCLLTWERPAAAERRRPEPRPPSGRRT